MRGENNFGVNTTYSVRYRKDHPLETRESITPHYGFSAVRRRIENLNLKTTTDLSPELDCISSN